MVKTIKLIVHKQNGGFKNEKRTTRTYIRCTRQTTLLHTGGENLH